MYFELEGIIVLLKYYLVKWIYLESLLCHVPQFLFCNLTCTLYSVLVLLLTAVVYCLRNNSHSYCLTGCHKHKHNFQYHTHNSLRLYNEYALAKNSVIWDVKYLYESILYILIIVSPPSEPEGGAEKRRKICVHFEE